MFNEILNINELFIIINDRMENIIIVVIEAVHPLLISYYQQ